MWQFGWREWLKQRRRAAGKGTRGRPASRAVTRRPRVEPLEERLVPATLTWTGAADTNWSTVQGGGSVTNWSASDGRAMPIPQNGDDLVFPEGAPNETNTDDISNLAVKSITFNGMRAAGGYAISATSGNKLTVNTAISESATGQPGTDSLLLPLTFPGNVTVTVAIPQFLNINGPIDGAGGLTKAGQGFLSLGGASANTYGGPTAVTAGFVNLVKNPGVVAVPHDLTIGTGAGSSTISMSPISTVVSLSTDGQIANGSRVTINSDGILNINLASDTIGSLTGSGLLQFGSGSSTSGMGSSTASTSAGTLNVGADNTSTTFAGTIAGSAGNFVKIGGGVLALSGNSPFGGTTSVSGGKLLVDGSLAGSATVANAGGTLGGSGTVGPLTANAGGVVAPGDSPGVLSVHGGATFNPGSVFLVAVNGAAAGSGYSQMNVAGPVALNGPFLQLALGFLPPRGVDFVLIANNGSGPVGGNFAGLPEDALLRHGNTFFDLSYAGGRGRDVDLLSQSRDDVFVRALFADFNAQSDRATRAPFEGRAGSGESRLSVSRDFLESRVRRMGLVNQFYTLFGMPDDGMKGVYLAQLMRGLPPGQVLINFINSRSFRRLHHNNRTFMLQLFAGLLGHPAGSLDRIGGHSLNFYVQQLNSGAVGRGQMVKQLLSSDEVYAAAVMQNHETFLGKPPSPAQLQATVGQMLVGALTPDSLSESIVATEVYLDFFLTRAGRGRVPGVVLVNV